MERPRRDSNPCYLRERRVSWARLDDRDVFDDAHCGMESLLGQEDTEKKLHRSKINL
jgi:hypothetical protein